MSRERHTIPVGTKFTIMGLTYTIVDINYCDSRSYLVRTPNRAHVWMSLGE